MTDTPHEILLASPIYGETMAALDGAYAVRRYWDAADRGALLSEAAGRTRALVASGATPVERAVTDALPKLEIITVFGVGYDGVDMAHARDRGIAVTNTPDVLTDDVADLAIGLAIDVARRMSLGDRFVRGGRWPQGNLPLARRFSGRRAGILGLGRIGLALARRLESFGMAITYHNRSRSNDVPYAYADDPVSLAAGCDFLFVVTPGGPSTRQLVDRTVLEALGPAGVLINVARGSVVDEAALVAALQNGTLGGAGLDVFADEPRVPEALFAMDQVVLQPHRGSATTDTRRAMGDLVLANLAAHFAGRPLITPVP